MVSTTRSFEILVLPHLDAGYNLARWLLRDEAAAEDAVQEASLRAFRYLDSLRGSEARPWFLRIVRNACYTYLADKRGMPELTGMDESELDQLQWAADHLAPDPSELLGQSQQRQRIDADRARSRAASVRGTGSKANRRSGTRPSRHASSTRPNRTSADATPRNPSSRFGQSPRGRQRSKTSRRRRRSCADPSS